jgi:hypothetical protein
MRKLTLVIFFIGFALIPFPVFSEEMLDYGAIWKAWGAGSQNAYLRGFVDGGSKVMMPLMDEIISSEINGHKIPKDFYENIRLKTATLFDIKKLRDVMTNLYRDPVNSYILFEDMVYVARDSLSGNDISDALLKARKQAIASYELNKNLKGK